MLRRWIIGLIWLNYTAQLSAEDGHQARFEKTVRPLLVKYCGDCHSSAEPKARLDLSSIESPESVESSFETFRAALQAVETGLMPPKDEARPTESEQRELRNWFDARFIDSKVEFVNVFTARFYGDDRRQLKKHRKPAGIEVQIVPNQRIELVATPDRGGILTMPGILAMNRGAISVRLQRIGHWTVRAKR